MEDYLRMIRVFVCLGIQKVRLTGGEPLLRKGIVSLVARLAELAQPTQASGRRSTLPLPPMDICWPRWPIRSRSAGLSRITVSMDAVDPATFARITRVPGSFEKVLAGVRAAQRAGLGPVKVNCVLLRGFNDDQIVPFARFSRDEGVIVRFIEFMPLEEDRLWTPEVVVPLDEVVRQAQQLSPAGRLAANNPEETARRYTFDDGVGEIGIIAPVSQAFCGACSRIRLTSDGKIRTCLFSHFDHDLYGVLARGGSDDDLAAFIREDSRSQGGAPPYRRARLSQTFTQHGPYRRLELFPQKNAPD